MELHIKKMLINEIGYFNSNKTSWLEYQEQMEKCFEKHQIRSILHKKEVCTGALGAKTLKVLKNLIKPSNVEDTDIDYNTIISKLDTHFYPNPNRNFYLTKFRLRKQKRYERFFDYVLALRELMNNLNFGKAQHSKLKNQIIEGTCCELKELFKTANSLNLSEVFEIGLKYDESRILKAAPPKRNHKARINRERTCFRCKASLSLFHEGKVCPFDWAICKHCKIKGHVSLACKYKDVECNNCGEKGHIKKLCTKEVANNSN